MSTYSDATLTAIALVDRLVLGDIAGVQALCAQVPDDELPVMVQCLATVLAAQTEQVHGPKAREVIAGWRAAALAGERDA